MISLKLHKPLHGAQGAFDLAVETQIAQGEFVALYGASGAGKTTLLRCLAGLDKPQHGYLQVHDAVWVDTSKSIFMPTQARRVGYMFQDYALFPNMTVRQNLEFALRKGQNKKRVDDLIEMMNLGELAQRKPASLSGGQQQRTALARALAAEPSLLLLDEPFAALDVAMRTHLQDELLRLQHQFGLTTLMVSHDVGEVYKLASRVLVLQQGQITQQGAPAQVFNTGKTSGKFRFTGEVLQIAPMDVMYALTILVGQQIVHVVATQQEITDLHVGDQVLLVSKAFNPMVFKLTQ
jgi:molybdate transport system ATP-binding protein